MIMIENMQNITLNGLPVYDDRYIKIKIRTYGAKVYTIFFGLNMPWMVQKVNLSEGIDVT